MLAVDTFNPEEGGPRLAPSARIEVVSGATGFSHRLLASIVHDPDHRPLQDQSSWS